MHTHKNSPTHSPTHTTGESDDAIKIQVNFSRVQVHHQSKKLKTNSHSFFFLKGVNFLCSAGSDFLSFFLFIFFF